MSHQPALQPHVVCLGNPVVGNPTQFVMSRATRECGLDWRFFTSQVREDEFETAVRGVQALGLHGMVLLDPFQTPVLPLLDTVTESARLLNRVTVARSDGNSWLGDNLLPTAIWQAIASRHPSATQTQPARSSQPTTTSPAMPQATTPVHSDKSQPQDRTTEANAARTASPEKIGEPATASATEPNAAPKNHVLFCGSEGTGQAMRAAWPNNNWDVTFWPMSSPLQDESVAEAIERIRSHQYTALVVENELNSSSLKNIPTLNWIANPTFLKLDCSQNRSDRKLEEVFQSRGFSTVEQVEWLSYEASSNFTFWTGVIPPIDLIRESLEEYLQW